MNLYKAAAQWAFRPVDERFWGIKDMYAAAQDIYSRCKEKFQTRRMIEVVATGENEVGMTVDGEQATFTNYAFGQVCGYASAPPSYLRSLPAELATQCLNVGLKTYLDRDGDSNILLLQNGRTMVRSMVTDSYSRLWDAEWLEVVADAAEKSGWRVPPARPAVEDARTRKATAEDVLHAGKFGLSINVGDDIAPGGAYLSDRDSFLFLVNDHEVEGFRKGCFISNSEVGAKRYEIWSFGYQTVCGNHIVWNASNVNKFAVRHMGAGIREGYSRCVVTMQEIADSSMTEFGDKIKKAKQFIIAKEKRDVVLEVMKFALQRRLPYTQKMIDTAIDIADTTALYGAPHSVFGVMSGLTQFNRDAYAAHADKRMVMDKAASRLLEMVR